MIDKINIPSIYRILVNRHGLIRIRKSRPQMGQLLMLFGILLPFLLSACSLNVFLGSGNLVTESRDVRDFDRVSFAGTGELQLTQNGEESLTITADDNLMDYIESEVRDETLFIGMRDTRGEFLPSRPIQFNLHVKDIAGLDIAGSAKVQTGALVSDRLAINVSGLSTLSMGALQAQKMDVRLSGSNEVELTGEGNVAEQAVEISGSSGYRAPELRSQRIVVTINGSGKAIVWATDSLSVTTSGRGDVDYYGHPQVFNNAAGNANVSSLGEP